MQQNRFLMAGRTQALPVRGWGAGDQFSTVLQELRAGQELDAETFIADARRAGEQRWLAPVQVNLRFADAASASRLSQVEKILDWCASQPFQALTVGEYARLMRDAAHTRIFQTSADRWVVVQSPPGSRRAPPRPPAVTLTVVPAPPCHASPPVLPPGSAP